jgi:signal transduction histidine kinase
VKIGGSHGLAKPIDSVGPWAALGLLAIVVGLGATSTISLFDNTGWVDHTHRVIGALDELIIGVSGAVISRRGFVLTRDAEQLDRYASSVSQLTRAKLRVRALTSDNPQQQHRLDALESLLTNFVARLDAAVAYGRTHGLEPEREAMETREGTAAYDELLKRTAVLLAEEARLLVQRERRTAEIMAWTKTIEAIGVCASLSLMATVVVRLRREIRRRTHSEQAVHESKHVITRLNDDLERRIDDRTAELNMANAELESFSYSVVHDLRAPLRGMSGFAEVLLNDCEDTLSADTRDCLREIQNNAHRMATLIDALVSMSRITRTPLTRTNVDLTGVAHAVANQLSADESRSPLVLHVEQSLEAVVDPTLVRALLEILLRNAWKFSSKAIAAQVDFGSATLNGERVLFVRDNGAGFDPAHADKLFVPFGRLHTVSEFPGVGIGLAIAQRIVKRHGGRIWADGHVGKGAVFYFTLDAKVNGGTA